MCSISMGSSKHNRQARIKAIESYCGNRLIFFILFSTSKHLPELCWVVNFSAHIGHVLLQNGDKFKETLLIQSILKMNYFLMILQMIKEATNTIFAIEIHVLFF